MTDHRRLPNYAAFVLSLAFLAAGLGACSGDDTQETGITCEADELYDHLNDTCVPRGITPQDAGTEDVDDPDQDDDIRSETPDAVEKEDVEKEDAIDMAICDKDNDGALAIECGGMDCDDNDPNRSPFLNEVCDGLDTNCNGIVNSGLDCTFYAHTKTNLYKIDPFAMTAEKVFDDMPYLTDIDTHPDGTLFGVKREGLFRFEPYANGGAGSWERQGYGFNLPGNSPPLSDPNGLAIDQEGVAYITSEDNIFSADVSSGHAEFVGATGDGFVASGDCVVDKGNTLYMTSKERGEPDTLVEVDRYTGEGSAVGELGAIGFERVFALTAAWGTLYGLTTNGELIEISRHDGVGTLVHTFEGKEFWGAASTPNR